MVKVCLAITTALVALAAVMAAFSAAINAPSGNGGLHPRPHILPAMCTCDEEAYAMDEGVARCQLASDFLIALAYFSIPLELVYFFFRSKILPHRGVLLQFGLFIVLCGSTHFVALWTYGPHAYSVALTLTILKILTAAVSCATAFLLIRIIPALLNIKVRELFLQHKAAALDHEMGKIRRQEEVGRHVRMLTQEIRSSLDRHTILNTTLVELAHTLDLHNCTVWTPPPAGGNFLELTYELERRLVQVPVRVPCSDSHVVTVVSTPEAIIIPPDSSLGLASSHRGTGDCPMAAVRLPLLQVRDFTANGSSASRVSGEKCVKYAVMVLVLPQDSGRSWKAHELEMLEAVADQVAVALSHATVLEESQRTRDALEDQNRALEVARQKAETAVRARNDFLAVMNHEMRTPLQAIIALTSLLQEAGLNAEQSPMVDTVLRSSSLLCTLINDVLQFSRLQEDSLELETKPFQLGAMLDEAAKLAWPVAQSQGVDFCLTRGEGLPDWVLGDEKRLLQTVLNVVGCGIKNAQMQPEGSVKMRVFVDHGLEEMGGGDKDKAASLRENDEQLWKPHNPTGRRHVYIRFEVADTGVGFSGGAGPQNRLHKFGFRPMKSPEMVPRLRASGSSNSSNPSAGDVAAAAAPAQHQSYSSTDLGLAICQKFVELMGGSMWIHSDGVGSGSTASFVVRLQQDLQLRVREEQGPIAEAFESQLADLRIMVVDDNSVNLMAEQALLQALGCDVTAVESAVDCLAELGARGSLPFDAVLLDICMPEIDGLDLAKRIMHVFRPEDRPLIIALTARTDKAVISACVEAGFDSVFLKPISIRELGLALAELVQANSRM